jgi:hypothetical protein
VRVLRGSCQGRVGPVTGLPDLPQQIGSGARVRCAEVDLGGTEGRTLIPFANLEIFR